LFSFELYLQDNKLLPITTTRLLEEYCLVNIGESALKTCVPDAAALKNSISLFSACMLALATTQCHQWMILLGSSHCHVFSCPVQCCTAFLPLRHCLNGSSKNQKIASNTGKLEKWNC
jgi:hypothetical protein